MADQVNQSQNVVEIPATVSATIRQSQNVIEIITPTLIEARQSQNVLEILSVVTTPLRQSQNVVELVSVVTPPPDLSGIYFIDPDKTHDSYYNGIERKIPNPIVRTALLGS